MPNRGISFGNYWFSSELPPIHSSFCIRTPAGFLLSFLPCTPFCIYCCIFLSDSSSNPCASPATRKVTCLIDLGVSLIMCLHVCYVVTSLHHARLWYCRGFSCDRLWLFVFGALLAVFPVSFWLCLIILLWIPMSLPTCYTLGFLLYFAICSAMHASRAFTGPLFYIYSIFRFVLYFVILYFVIHVRYSIFLQLKL